MTIVIPTPTSKKLYQEQTEYRCLERLQEKYLVLEQNEEGTIKNYFKCNAFQLDIVENNKKGLSKLYNEKLIQYKDNDIVVFMHDDLEIHDQFLVDKLKVAHQHYDIVGLAGATTQSYNKGQPLVWHLSKDRPEDSRGIVSHFIPKGAMGGTIKETHYNSAYFGPTPGPVAVMDGLFMSFKMSALKDNYKIFDDEFDWHHYDMAMCLNAKERGLTMGVWPIFCVHRGLGEFADQVEWQKSAKLFNKKVNE